MTAAVRIVHFSDMHRTTRPLGWRWRDIGGRRVTGWFNWHGMGRGARFRDSDKIVRIMAAELRQRRPDGIVFSGDAAGIGFEREIEETARVLGVGDPELPPAVAAPGNHDYYTAGGAASGAFEGAFAPWQVGERVDDERYPFARRVGPLWMVALNSATPRRWPWDASGLVGPRQLDRLATLLRRLAPGPRILVTHYPVRLASGGPEHRWHGLRDVNDAVRVAADGGVVLWLHGHRHGSYVHEASAECPFPTICAGSVSQAGKASYAELSIGGESVTVLRRVFDPAMGEFRDGTVTELPLP